MSININRLNFLVLLFTLFTSMNINAQLSSGEKAIVPLKKNDKIPSHLWNITFNAINLPDGNNSLKLGAFKDKLIILDFWATWCIPCISSLNKLDKVQEVFGDSVLIIPITYEDSSSASVLFKKKEWKLSSIVNDSVLVKYFPHRTFPHHVLIMNGKVLSIPANNITEEDINKLLSKQEIDFIERNSDVKFDASFPLLIDGNGGNAENLLFQSKITHFIDAEIAGERFRPNSLLMYNYPIQHLFLTVNKYRIPWHGRRNRIVSRLDSALSNKVFMKESPSGNNFEELQNFRNWREVNLYCYQLLFPEGIDRTEMFYIAERDLNRFFKLHLGVQATIETLPTRCLTIVRLSQKSIRPSIEDKEPVYENNGDNTRFVFVNKPFSQFFGVFAEQNWRSPLPVIDQTHYQGNISFTFAGPLTDYKIVKEELNKNGFDIIEKELPVEMLVFYSVK